MFLYMIFLYMITSYKVGIHNYSKNSWKWSRISRFKCEYWCGTWDCSADGSMKWYNMRCVGTYKDCDRSTSERDTTKPQIHFIVSCSRTGPDDIKGSIRILNDLHIRYLLTVRTSDGTGHTTLTSITRVDLDHSLLLNHHCLGDSLFCSPWEIRENMVRCVMKIYSVYSIYVCLETK